MPFLRKIRKARWFNSGLVWIGEGDMPGDALSDLSTTDNQLSVWWIDEEKKVLDQVLAALALNCNYISNIDYVLIRDDHIEAIKKLQTPGDTPDNFVNELHYSLYEITANKILSIAKAINTSEIKRANENYIKSILQVAITKKEIDRTKIKLTNESIERIGPIDQ